MAFGTGTFGSGVFGGGVTTNLTQQDSAGATDTTVKSQARRTTDTAGATDATARTASRALAATDSAGAADAVTLVRRRVLVLTDTAAATDTAAQAWARARVLTDAAGPTDAVTPALTSPGRVTLADNAGAADLLAVTAQLHLARTDRAGATDALRVSGSGRLSLTDTAGAGDVARLSARLRPGTDNAGATDVADVTATQRPAEAVDNAGAVDGLTLRRRITLADAARATDALLINGQPPAVDEFGLWAGLDHLGSDRVVVHNAPLITVARHGSRVRDWAQQVSTPLAGCSVQPYSAAEMVTDREFASTHLKLFAPAAAGALLAAVSRVEFDGVTYEVDGEPGRWRDLEGVPSHIEAALKRLTG